MTAHAHSAAPAHAAARVETARVADTAAGLLLVVVGAGFLTVTMLAASIAPAYDLHGGAISDLGVIDETALLFNALLVAIGLLNAGAGLLLFRSHRSIWLLGVYLLAGAGAAGAGFVPLDASGFHSLFALFGFLFFNIEVVASAALVESRPMRAISYVAGLVGLVYVVVMVIGDAGNPVIFGAIGHGGAERMIVYPAMLWTLVFGGHLLAGTAQERHSEGRQT